MIDIHVYDYPSRKLKPGMTGWMMQGDEVLAVVIKEIDASVNNPTCSPGDILVAETSACPRIEGDFDIPANIFYDSLFDMHAANETELHNAFAKLEKLKKDHKNAHSLLERREIREEQGWVKFHIHNCTIRKEFIQKALADLQKALGGDIKLFKLDGAAIQKP